MSWNPGGQTPRSVLSSPDKGLAVLTKRPSPSLNQLEN